MKRLFALFPITIAGILGAFLLWGLNPDRDPNEIPSVLISQPVPEFDLPPVEGLDTHGLSSTDLVENDGSVPIVVNVFASWCVPCRAEHAVLTRMVRDEGIRLMGINYKDKPQDARKWLDDLGNPYERIGSDLDGRAGIEWGISGVPETFVIDGAGKVVFRFVGPVLGDEAISKMRTALDQARAAGGEAS